MCDRCAVLCHHNNLQIKEAPKWAGISFLFAIFPSLARILCTSREVGSRVVGYSYFGCTHITLFWLSNMFDILYYIRQSNMFKLRTYCIYWNAERSDFSAWTWYSASVWITPFSSLFCVCVCCADHFRLLNIFDGDFARRTSMLYWMEWNERTSDPLAVAGPS